MERQLRAEAELNKIGQDFIETRETYDVSDQETKEAERKLEVTKEESAKLQKQLDALKRLEREKEGNEGKNGKDQNA